MSSQAPINSSDETYHETQDGLQHNQRRARRPNTNAVLARATGDQRVLGGVIGGIANYIDTSPGWLRVVTVISVIVTGGITALGYLLLWLLLPAKQINKQNPST
jgi:phage shock protein PspC (stress-responsive transcriptional regulator)